MTYKLRYTIEPGEFAKDDYKLNQGLCDAMLFASVVKGEDGSTSTVWVSRDGDGCMKPSQIMNHWALLAKDLSHYKGLTEEAKSVCNAAFEAIRALVLKGRSGEKNQSLG